MYQLSKICSIGLRLLVASKSTTCVVHIVKRNAGTAKGKYLVLAFGNPILDSVVQLKNKDIINKFRLQEDGHKQTNADEMQRILKEVERQKYKWSNVPGGSALNTMRVLQWLVGDEPSTIIFGAVGKDVNATLLAQMVEKFKVRTQFAYIERFPTAWVFSLAHKDNRSLIASIGAAELYNIDHFTTHENERLLKECDLVYMEGFFITRRKEISRHILGLCQANNKRFAFNLNAEYLINEFTEDMIYFVENSSILFGNFDEFTMMARVMKLSMDEMVKKLVAAMPDKIVVITDGAKPVFSHTQKASEKFDVPPMNHEEIVDATGCGDAFAAGYIYGHLSGEPAMRCMKWGTWMAQKILRQIGCVPPGDTPPADIQNVK